VRPIVSECIVLLKWTSLDVHIKYKSYKLVGSHTRQRTNLHINLFSTDSTTKVHVFVAQTMPTPLVEYGKALHSVHIPKIYINNRE